METKARCKDIKDIVVDPESFIDSIPEERLRMLIIELDMLREDYERENTIMYLSSNYSSNKHLSFTVLRGLCDEKIIEIMESTRVILTEELRSRKKNALSGL